MWLATKYVFFSVVQEQAPEHAKTYKGKPWKYLLMPNDVIAENIALEWTAT